MSKWNLSVLVFSLMSALAAPSWAADPAPETVEVVSAGSGTTEEQATQRAIVNAVRQGVGMVVDAETVVSNDEVIKDRVLSASNAIVTKYEPIGRPERDGDSVTIQIRATVQKGEVRRRLAEANVVSVEVDGAAAFAKAASALQNDADAVEVVRAAFDGFPGNVLKGTPLGDPVVVGKEGTLNLVAVGIRVEVDRERYTQWIEAYTPLFARVANKTTERRFDPYAPGPSLAQGGRNNFGNSDIDRFAHIPLDARATSFDTNELFPSFGTTPGTLTLIYRIGASKAVSYELPTSASLAVAAASVTRPTLEVTLLDAGGSEVSGNELVAEFTTERDDTLKPAREHYVAVLLTDHNGHLNHSYTALARLAEMGFIVSPYLSGNDFRPSAFEGSVAFRLTDAELAKVKSVKSSMRSRSSEGN